MSQHGALVHPAFLEEYFPVFQIVECFLFLLLELTLIPYCYLLFTKRVFHPNLTTLLLSQPFVLSLSTLIRLIRHILQKFDLLDVVMFQMLSFVSESIVGVSLHMTIVYAIERYIAMKNLETYEQKYSNNRLSLWLLTSTVSLAMSITLSSVVFEATIFYWRILPDWLPFVAAYTISFIGVFFFIKLHFVCKERYYFVFNERHSTVEARYNTQENFKASHLLLYLAPYKCLTSILLVAFYEIFVEYSLFTQTFYTYIFFYLIQLQITFQMWMTIFLNPSLQKRFLSLFRKAPITSNEDLLNVLGKKIKYNNADESNLYFKQLEKMWN